ncbi:hypothetical protein CHLNCDRAFT_135608 [Chlorella variabilis]|uniref:Uncharacterized protein n=1 Tax=Chlorella variabilis TaxID=554065 RepID=E1ZIK5_CHLVA|nr:hypothetical protein CHLNCDRAFT_135608 [Chlorella variabilis]EFN54350.1 hypothetical protein CHLNCDRAFT_135608 [Chlorella variabilis]|eukprot:XP_005846452.1 hypothetical protein CHLNCDRAFT_135608 [Chlorella variabilis]
MVTLIREPDNPYDGWAIRVDNVRNVKVGHLPRVLVCHLSPLIDQGLLVLEGIVPRAGGAFKMPVQLWCFAEPQNRQRVVARLRAAGKVLNDPAQAGGGGSGGRGGGASGRGGASTSATAEAPARLSAKQMEDSVDRLFDELMAESGPRQRLAASPEVVTALYPHQQEALAWMVRRENSNALPPFWGPRVADAGGRLTYVSQLTNFISTSRPRALKGGILCDDMGLGKTLQVIALTCTNAPGVQRRQLRFFTEGEAEAEAGLARQGDDAAAEEEEQEERPKKRQRKGKEKVGAKPAAKAAGPSQAPKTKAGKLAVEAAERAVAEEVPAAPPAASGPRGTLIVCPLSVMSNWQMQLEEHTQGKLSVCVYHGPDRDRRVASLSSYDVVITTYNILAQELSLQNGVCKVDWLRVCADEAHTIKNTNTQMARAAYALRAERRWAITGTPLQNTLQDLHGITRFLRLEPLDDRALFVRTLERPIKARDPLGLKRLQVLMGTIALRRTKAQQVNGRPLVALPDKTVHQVAVQLDAASRAKYERWQAAGRAIVERHLEEGTLLQNYTMVLEVLLRPRQICCHASLAPGEDPSFLAQQPAAGAKLTPELAAQLVELLRAGLDEECPVCLSELAQPCITLCKHIFCKRCIQMVINRDKAACPMCRGAISEKELVEVPEEPEAGTQEAAAAAAASRGGAAAASAAGGGGFGSAKVAALLERLRQDAAATAAGAAAGAGGGAVKSVVFSQFTSYLDLVEAALAGEGFVTGRLDGKTSAKRRGEVLRAFQSSSASSPTVLLVSLKAGGVGLNLTAASRVHLLDPWWNPSVEEQAMDRVHRLGQTRADSIEERMLALQEQKRDLMRVAFDRRKAEDIRQERINDVRMLMEL